MSKSLTVGGMVVAILLLTLFLVDLLDWMLSGLIFEKPFGFPFKGASPLMDIAFIICSIILGYLSWSAFKELQ
jgi:hypothetical protein